jgi:KDO2-lipid IV(A) lauroyltransferase
MKIFIKIFGAFLGFIFRKLKFRYAVILQNSLICFPEFSALERDRFIRRAYSHFGKLLAELLVYFVFFKLVDGSRWLKQNVRLKNWELWEEALEQARSQGTGVLLITSHLGNWEWMAARGALEGMDLLMVTKLLKPARLHRWIEQCRLRYGVKGTYEPKTLKDVFRHLKAQGTVGMVIDQYAGPPVGIRVPFFNVPVGTQSAIATIVKRTGAIVLFVHSVRQSDGSYQIVFAREDLNLEAYAPLVQDQEIGAQTAFYTQVIEKQIMKHPGQWLWTHRRFKGDCHSVPLEELKLEWQQDRKKR